jgi:hypothetical protein
VTGFEGDVVGRISTQQIRVFALFSVAFFLTGLAFTYHALGNTMLAAASVGSAVAFIGAIIVEARTS